VLAIIGGSGLYELAELADPIRMKRDTRWGDPSDSIVKGRIGRLPVLFLPRHAHGHKVPPHRINYRANLWALRDAGATEVVAVAAVGGIATDCPTGALVVPDQIIDYTSGRDATYFDGDDGNVMHVDFTEPYDAGLRDRLVASATRLQVPVVKAGVYGCTNGPRLETAAEIRRLQKDGCTVVGMTGMPEAVLARELGLRYACLAVVANAAAGTDVNQAEVSVEAIMASLARSMTTVQRVLAEMCRATVA